MVAAEANSPEAMKAERRLRRAARRAKQRSENSGRAAKMHVARMAWESERRSDAAEAKNLPLQQFHVGCSGWFYWDWRGKFYDADLPTSQWFSHYADQFKTVELNAPFYSWPTTNTVRGWRRQLGRKKFVYTVKVPELITHIKKFSGTKTLIRDFGHVADLLGPHMGCFLFQLPPSFHYTTARLTRILSQLDPARRNVVEFRHSSWWNDRVFTAFRENGTIFCSTSGPRLPSDLIKTADDIYIRFHGIERWYRHDYTRAELAEWTGKVAASGASRVWAYFNNDWDGYALKNARAFLRQLRASALKSR